MSATADQALAELRRAYEGMRSERDALALELQARTEALAQRNSEYGERIEQQAATIDVLKAMSASAGDAQPVFRLIVERARAFCEADGASLALLRGDMLHLQTYAGFFRQDYEAVFPCQVSRSTMFGRAVLASDVVQMPDVSVDPDHYTRERTEQVQRAIIAVPLLRAGAPIGAIAIGRRRSGEFSTAEVELLKTFAEQAVIAISSAEAHRELQARTATLAQRNSEYGERIEQQAATIDVLKVMSASPDDTQPVFDQIVNRAQELCNGWDAVLFEFDGQLVHIRAHTRKAPEAEMAAYVALFPMAPTRGSITCRAIMDRQIVHVRDMDAETTMPAVRSLLHKSQLTIPLMRDGAAIGAITLASLERGGFSDSQVALLQTFAEQAVITCRRPMADGLGTSREQSAAVI